MRSTFERIIRNGTYNLEQMLRRINYYHAEGRLTDEDREALISLARGEAPNALELDGKAEILALWREIHALQARVTALEVGGEEPGETPEDGPADDSAAFPEYVQPTGAHDAYQAGQGVTWNGKRYRSLIDANVWSPDVYPQGWELVEG